MRLYIFRFLCFLFPLCAFSQTGTAPIHSRSEQWADRLFILNGGTTDFHPELKAFLRKDLVRIALDADSIENARAVNYLLVDNDEWLDSLPDVRQPLLKHFYQTPSALFEVRKEHFKLKLNPLLNVSAGAFGPDGTPLFINSRGAEIRGSIDNKVYFQSSVVETQFAWHDYLDNWVETNRAIPGAGFYKTRNKGPFGLDKSFDFNVANAQLGFQISKHIGLELGHGQHFIGNGYRSLFLSDFGSYYFYLKLNTRVWKLQYQNLFLELSPVSQRVISNNQLLPKKYAALHYLHLNLSPTFGIGLFEATVFNRSRQFEWQYLNPIVLYRSVEGLIGSPDNVMLGMDLRWDILNRYRLYGQFLIDEFRLSDVVNPEEKGWWGNKFAWQVGLRAVNVAGVRNLDLQLEFNAVRPYTYSHFDSLNAWTHYSQSLAHPSGANFKEYIALLRYQPAQRLELMLRYLFIDQGRNGNLGNWGSVPGLSNESRIREYGNEIGQGEPVEIRILGLDASWAIYHNLFVDLKLAWRHETGASYFNFSPDAYALGSVGLRYNIWPQNFDF